MSLFAAAPTFAQQSLTANQAETVVKTVFPAVMEQVKLASGLDIQAIAEGNMDWTLYSRIPTVTVQPDSAHINVSALIAMMKDDETDAASSRFDMSGIISSMGLDKMKVSFSDYQKINFSMGELTSEISCAITKPVSLNSVVTVLMPLALLWLTVKIVPLCNSGAKVGMATPTKVLIVGSISLFKTSFLKGIVAFASVVGSASIKILIDPGVNRSTAVVPGKLISEERLEIA